MMHEEVKPYPVSSEELLKVSECENDIQLTLEQWVKMGVRGADLHSQKSTFNF